MMLDLLTTAVDATLADELLQRTASTPRVQQIVQLSLAPAFLLGGIGAIMNVMMTRLLWIAERIERIGRREDDGQASGAELSELPWLARRRRHAQHALVLSTAAAAAISVVIALLFVAAYIEPRIGTLIALAWILTVLLLIASLAFLLFETRLAARGAKVTPRRGI